MSATATYQTSPQGVLRIRLAGAWKLKHRIPSAAEINRQIESASDLNRISFDASDLQGWDSGLLTYVLQVRAAADKSGLELDCSGLPKGVQGLLQLAGHTDRLQEPPVETGDENAYLADLGNRALDFWGNFLTALEFVGETAAAFARLPFGGIRFRGSDLWRLVQECGAQALPIVSLISLLVGLILAFVGAVQLKLFGAQIYIADLVAIGMTREMGAMMAAVIMAGRTGAAFAAQLGTTQVNEEIDALKTLGVSPIEFLVVPRVLALVLMMPFLTVYADAVGILGGMLVGVGAFGITVAQYWDHTIAAVTLTYVFIGVFKSLIFGAIIALCGCLRGMQCGRSAQDVGAAATSAVVTAIVWVIVADGVFAVMCDAMGI